MNLFKYALIAVLAITTAGLAEKRPFKSLCYGGYRDGQSPGGGGEPTRAQVLADLQLLVAYTHGIRSYSCGAGGHEEMLPQICDDLGLSLYMGVWISDNDASNTAQIQNAIRLVAEGHPSIKSIIVGNEYILRTNVAGTPMATCEAKIIAAINQVKAGVPEAMVVTTAEPYWWWAKASDALWIAADEIYWHSHPFWDNQAIGNAYRQIENHYNLVRQRIAALPAPHNTKKDKCTETGWPSGGAYGNGPVGSLANQVQYVRDLHSYAYPKDLEYFFFEAFDEQWKVLVGDPKEAEAASGDKWGLWYSNRTPKSIISDIVAAIPVASQWEETHDGVQTVGKPRISIRPVTLEYSDVYNLLGRKILMERDFSKVSRNQVLIPVAE